MCVHEQKLKCASASVVHFKCVNALVDDYVLLCIFCSPTTPVSAEAVRSGVHTFLTDSESRPPIMLLACMQTKKFLIY